MSKKQLSLLMSLTVVLLFGLADLIPTKAVKIWVYDVGQGDAIFIEGPEKQVLIDGGPGSRVLEELSATMPWWDRSIDVVVNTHPHADHLAGLVTVLEQYDVKQVLDADQSYDTPEFAEYINLAKDKRQIISAGDVIDLGGGATLTTLWPSEPYDDAMLGDPNDGSIVMLFQYGETTVLLTGDAGIEEEAFWDVGDIDILKVGHHGSETSTGQELLDRIKPEVAIISVGENNDYGHPDPFVVDRLERNGVEVYRTDLDGTVRIKTAGGEPEIATFFY